tara:strand:+ start:347 stop:763 length:417 start_codon:yes stop_codon:yes gene_type:complete
MVQGIFSGTFLRAAGLLLLLLTAVSTFIWITSGAATTEQFGDGLEVVCSSYWRSTLTMTTVGYDKSPHTFTGRVIGLDLEFTSIIVIDSTTGAMASAFTVQSLSLSMHQLDNKRHGLIAHRSSLNCASITRQPQEYLS